MDRALVAAAGGGCSRLTFELLCSFRHALCIRRQDGETDVVFQSCGTDPSGMRQKSLQDR
jgi:hypothetical protein